MKDEVEGRKMQRKGQDEQNLGGGYGKSDFTLFL